MSYFPFFIDLQGQQGLIVGGGMIAFRKIKSLLSFGADLAVVSIDFCRPLLELADESEVQSRLTLCRRAFVDSDLDGKFFVIAATDDERLNHHIAGQCKEKRILVNVVDKKEDCSFYFSALIKKGDIVTGISSGGSSPVLARTLRKRLEGVIPDYYAVLNEQLGDLREHVKAELATEELRKKCFEELFAAGEEKQGTLSKEEIHRIIGKYRLF